MVEGHLDALHKVREGGINQSVRTIATQNISKTKTSMSIRPLREIEKVADLHLSNMYNLT